MNGIELFVMDVFTFLMAVVGLVAVGRLWEQRIVRKRTATTKAADAVK
jgi:hypothetical protein